MPYFQKLKTAHKHGTPAPHKPILLLSILQSIAAHEITENRIYITPELVARFKDNWHLLVKTDTFVPNFALPFYHLKSEGWWHLQTYPGREILLTRSHSIRSFPQLKDSVAYAFFDAPLYALAQAPASREVMMQTLLQTYFGGSPPTLFSGQGYGLSDTIEGQILHEAPALYKAQVAAADEEEIFVRSGIFKKVIPRIYNYTCCISGMRIIASREVQMIDACHIIPFAESRDDTVGNGLSLCPNLHRAFDRHLIAIDADYRVVVSESFTEKEGGAYSIKTLAGKPILLPSDANYHPRRDNLAVHHAAFSRKQ